jgi:hypothetical protein
MKKNEIKKKYKKPFIKLKVFNLRSLFFQRNYQYNEENLLAYWIGSCSWAGGSVRCQWIR